MKCPVDGTVLVISERSSVEIDYCPQCRGVWLDRGELDKIIDQSVSMPAPPRGVDHGRSTKPKKKRESFLGELFDF